MKKDSVLWNIHGAATLLAMVIALWAVFVYAPTEKQMGMVQRIFYFPRLLGDQCRFRLFPCVFRIRRILAHPQRRLGSARPGRRRTWGLVFRFRTDLGSAVGTTDLGRVLALGTSLDDDDDHLHHLRHVSDGPFLQ